MVNLLSMVYSITHLLSHKLTTLAGFARLKVWLASLILCAVAFQERKIDRSPYLKSHCSFEQEPVPPFISEDKFGLLNYAVPHQQMGITCILERGGEEDSERQERKGTEQAEHALKN